MSLIALDIGTSGMRAVIYGLDGSRRGTSYFEYHSDFPQPGYVEQETQSWLDAAVMCLKGISGYLKAGADEPQAITVTSQRSSLIPMGKDGKPLRNAIMWQDKRTVKQCEALIEKYTLQGLYRRTGLRINPYFVLPKILWLRENQREIYDAADKFIGVQDLVVHFLTGEYVTDHSQACRTMLMDIKTFTWDRELLGEAGIGADRLPRLVAPGTVAGSLTGELAELTGLPAGLPMIIAGGDQQNAAVALGVVRPGVAEANTGTGSFVICAVDRPAFERSARVLCQASAIAGQWIMEAGIFNTGSTYRWMKEQLCPDLDDDPAAYERMNREAEQSRVGSNGVMLLPHFEGSAAPFWNPGAKGIFFNLSLGTKRGDMIRAIMEGIAIEINDNVSLIEITSGKISTVSVAGGMVRSDLFCQIQADIYNKKVARYKNSEASSLGAAMIAAVTLGAYGSVEEAYHNMVSDRPRLFEPVPENAEHTLKLLERKHKLYNALVGGNVYGSFGERV